MKRDELRLCKEFYREQEIRTAVRDYAGIASVGLTEEEDYFVCVFSACRAEPRLVMSEFANYVLGLTVKGHAV